MLRTGRQKSLWGLVAGIGIGSLALALLKPTVWQVVVVGGMGFMALIAAAALARWHLEAARLTGATTTTDTSPEASSSTSSATAVPRCRLCGENVGVVCWRCGSLQSPADRTTRLSAFIVRRWTAVVLVMATGYAPSLINAIRDRERTAQSDVRETERTKEEVVARRRVAAQKLAEAWGAFRAPLINAAVQCGADVGHQQPLAAPCRELFSGLVQGYAQVSWYLPEFVVDLRERGCAKPDLTLVKEACARLRPPADLVRPSAEAFHELVNAYAAYNERLSRDNGDKMAHAFKDFYDYSRQLGCALSFAGLENPHPADTMPSQVIDNTSPFCERFLVGGNDQEPSQLEIVKWFNPPTESPEIVRQGPVGRATLRLAASNVRR